MGTKGSVALGTLPLAGLIAAPHTFKAEDVEALGKHSVLLAGVTAGAGQISPVRMEKKRTITSQLCSRPGRNEDILKKHLCFSIRNNGPQGNRNSPGISCCEGKGPAQNGTFLPERDFTKISLTTL